MHLAVIGFVLVVISSQFIVSRLVDRLMRRFLADLNPEKASV
jgi:hypothetical protein